MSQIAPSRVRAAVATACIFGGAALFGFSALWPTVRLAIPGPMFHLAESAALAVGAFIVGLVGCYLSDEFVTKAKALVALAIGGTLIIAGAGAFASLMLSNPADIFGRGSLIALAMAAAGYGVVRLLVRPEKKLGNVT